jgi:hypothetical protein
MCINEMATDTFHGHMKLSIQAMMEGYYGYQQKRETIEEGCQEIWDIGFSAQDKEGKLRKNS